MSDEVRRLRPPRFIHSDGIIRAFVYKEAEGNGILMVCNTDYESHNLVVILAFFILVILDKSYTNLIAVKPVWWSYPIYTVNHFLIFIGCGEGKV